MASEYTHHTNEVTSLVYDPFSHRLISGGRDRQVVVEDVTVGRKVMARKLPKGAVVTNVLFNEALPSMVLITTARSEQQMCLLDARSGQLVHTLGDRTKENLSRFVKPDWHSNGYTVVCGTQSAPQLNFWDLRYQKVAESTFRFTLPHAALQCKFMPEKNTIAVATSTRQLLWIDYSPMSA
ncbi:hypothetical protein DM01DRAFT_1126649 [Hesseltinella vesiculosa]|uniref:Uncharacterized protein n=1 Tax=Hesseltinella vesiculosa TaxID=101127 RepID=A0A1X2GUF4_9FUNG|nr:hypothetical protein DM01DRAFT_1126649 [Hesseltinella vesiculosa]